MKLFKNLTILLASSFFFLSCTKEVLKKNLTLELESAANLTNPSSNFIPDRYIVVLKDDTRDVNTVAISIGNDFGAAPDHVYEHAIKGFSIKIPLKALERLKKNPNVKYIEQDQVINTVQTTQTQATWGIDRIDQVSLPLSNTYTHNNTGNLVDVYVIDTGIRFGHSEFEARAVKGIDVFSRRGTASDGNGHGTHVAGTIGGKTYGVAKKVKLFAVRVLDNRGSGSTSGVVAGIDWVISHHLTGKQAVANMSLGGGISATLDAAVNNAIIDGVVMCVAAGNSNADASNSSPARVLNAITVGATDISDLIAGYSNYGTIVDINAPGTDITSAWYTSNTAVVTISGTSMATPHVAGAAALYLNVNPTANPQAVRDALVNTSTKNVLTMGIKTSSPNSLLFVSPN